MPQKSPLEMERLKDIPLLPDELKDVSELWMAEQAAEATISDELKSIFPLSAHFSRRIVERRAGAANGPLKVGVVLSGGQAAGGHNVIIGLFDALKKIHPKSTLIGFLNGPSGIFENNFMELSQDILKEYRNQGGFDLLGSGRTKIETPEQFQKAGLAARAHPLDGLVIIGGDDSNTNAALLAEYFLSEGIPARVVGVPKTIDGDLKNQEIEISFGFDTAAKTYSSLIGNIQRDALSARKYYFFIKLMGRSASHIALECALQAHPNLTLIGEEIARNKHTLQQITNQAADLICARAALGKDFGVILVPEGVVEFIPEMQGLIAELNQIGAGECPSDQVKQRLSPAALQCFESIPPAIQGQLLLDRDPHGNVQVSKIETERLLLEAVSQELKRRKERGHYAGKFSAQPLFFGYEGRSCLPSSFDCRYCYALGHTAALLIKSGATGYMAGIRNLSRALSDWRAVGIPLTSLLHFEERKGKRKPVIKKALVDLEGKPFAVFQERRKEWGLHEDYRYPGPIQFFGPDPVVNEITFTLEYESNAL